VSGNADEMIDACDVMKRASGLISGLLTLMVLELERRLLRVLQVLRVPQLLRVPPLRWRARAHLLAGRRFASQSAPRATRRSGAARLAAERPPAPSPRAVPPIRKGSPA